MGPDAGAQLHRLLHFFKLNGLRFCIFRRDSACVRNRCGRGGQRKETKRFGFCLCVFCLPIENAIDNTQEQILTTRYLSDNVSHLIQLVMSAAGPSLQRNNAVTEGLSWLVAYNISPGLAVQHQPAHEIVSHQPGKRWGERPNMNWNEQSVQEEEYLM